ncbi:MAG: endonuclease/exonuclease/phosphatase family protein [Bdellovibrionales bacterium]|nr:endonuclease/exonuclease/phosphatase family protein [Bdellovibrionales bacterium]
MRLRVFTNNIHKGVCIQNRRYVLPGIRAELLAVDPDIVFLQEVQGNHLRRQRRFVDWADASQEQYLAQERWPFAVYGRNASYPAGHHGNSILSKYRIEAWRNYDVSTTSFERRGVLYALVRVDDEPLHCFCVHFDLRPAGRIMQFAELARLVRTTVPDDQRVIVAGDFNDPGTRGARLLTQVGLQDCFLRRHGRRGRTFPTPFPLLALDRILVKNISVTDTQVLATARWKNLSDHFPVVSDCLLGGRRYGMLEG